MPGQLTRTEEKILLTLAGIGGGVRVSARDVHLIVGTTPSNVGRHLKNVKSKGYVFESKFEKKIVYSLTSTGSKFVGGSKLVAAKIAKSKSKTKLMEKLA
jgi:DNA-binding MarR family transcriptional regulator